VKYIEEVATYRGPMPMVELTRRNLEGLLEKLDDPNSVRTLIDPEGEIAVKAVEDAEHYKTRPAGDMFTNGEFK